MFSMQLHHVAPTGATVLLLGETGVGKELFAQAIHDASPRRRLPMILVNCAAIPATLIESELFGHERGAFTGAVTRQMGRFEAANGSTIFLDEIGEMPLDMQVKLLRVLQERTIERLGCNGAIKVDVRIIAATNRNLEQAVANNTFREDLFYRLNVFPITIPPLRERVDDIPGLVSAFIRELAPSVGKRIDGISSQSLMGLQQYTWPGNVRELRNLIEREMILAKGPILTPTVPQTTRAAATPRQRATRRRANRAHQVGARQLRLAHSRQDWRRRTTGPEAHDAGDPDDEAGDLATQGRRPTGDGQCEVATVSTFYAVRHVAGRHKRACSCPRISAVDTKDNRTGDPPTAPSTLHRRTATRR